MKLLDSLKFSAGLALCVLVRLFAVTPNFEPIMGFTMPFAKKYGKYAGLVFALLALVAIDFFTRRIGLWTVYTGITYAAVGFAAGRFFEKRKADRKNLLVFSIAGTLAFDLVTALAFGWQFNQTLAATILGQVPFTAVHLLGNAAYALLASPAILWALEKTSVKQIFPHSIKQ
ncbi:MAG: DUF6580 family putative transport protein [Candidatus Micrarchaeota archaeon]